MTQLPVELCALGELKELIISYNQIEMISMEWGGAGALPSLESINALRAGLQAIHGLPHHLKKASFGGNAITALPEGLEHLQKLEHLDLCYNELSEFTTEHLKVLSPSLKVIYLSWNEITDIPADEILKRLPNAVEIALEGNPLIGDLSILAGTTPQATVEWLKHQMKQ